METVDHFSCIDLVFYLAVYFFANFATQAKMLPFGLLQQH
jgi:hypothetical protein